MAEKYRSRNWKRGFLAGFISWKLFSENIENKNVCVCVVSEITIDELPIRRLWFYYSFIIYIITNQTSDVHVTYYWDELWGKESTGSESGPHGRLEQVLYFHRCLFLLICFWLSLTLTCNIVSQYSSILCTRIKDSMFRGLKS